MVDNDVMENVCVVCVFRSCLVVHYEVVYYL